MQAYKQMSLRFCMIEVKKFDQKYITEQVSVLRGGWLVTCWNSLSTDFVASNECKAIKKFSPKINFHVIHAQEDPPPRAIEIQTDRKGKV